MSKAKRSLTTSDIKTLVDLDTAYKKAKKALDTAKAELIPESVSEGKYVVADYGCVSKIAIVQTVVDYKRLVADHPEIDVSLYTTYKEAPRILFTDYREEQVEDDTSFFKKLLKH